jgi:hypothetical protein
VRRALTGVVVALFVFVIATMVPSEWIRKAWAYSGDFYLWVSAGNEFISHNRAGIRRMPTSVRTGSLRGARRLSPQFLLGRFPTA